MADCHTAHRHRKPRAKDGYGTDAVEPGGWPMTIEEEVAGRQAQAAAKKLARMLAQGRA